MHYRQIVIKAEVQNVSQEGKASWSSETDTVAELETKVRLAGRFDREQVATLVTNIVNQLVAAFDEGDQPTEDPGLEKAADPEWRDATAADFPEAERLADVG